MGGRSAHPRREVLLSPADPVNTSKVSTMPRPSLGFRHWQQGVSAIEYGLLAALIALVAIVGMTALGNANEAGWDAWVARVLAVISPP
jgi:Flp pilus assembly pilin Flp